MSLVAQGKFGYPVVVHKAGAAAVREVCPRVQSLACDCLRRGAFGGVG